MISAARNVFRKYPLTRGMAAYAVIWPVSSCIQQTFTSRDTIDFKRAGRFCLYGSMYVAPTLYAWVKISSKLFPGAGFKVALIKALVEQISYGPFANISFFTGMTLLEGGSFEDAKEELRAKFWPTYKVGLCVWPVLQTINFTFVPEKNRVIYVAFCSLMWTSFLAYMKYLESSHIQLVAVKSSKDKSNPSCVQ